MKQTYVVVVDHKEILNEIHLSMIIQSGLFDHYYEDGDKISVVKVAKQNVEQNCGTPESINKEALTLLSKAVERIKFYCEKAYGSSKEFLAEQIEEYLIEIQR